MYDSQTVHDSPAQQYHRIHRPTQNTIYNTTPNSNVVLYTIFKTEDPSEEKTHWEATVREDIKQHQTLQVG